MPRLSTHYQALLRSYVDSVKVNSVSEGAEAMYVRLLSVSDGEGRYYADPFTIAAKACSERLRRNSDYPDTVAGHLDELEAAGLLQRYVGEDSIPYLGIENYYDAGNKQRATHPPPAGDGHPLAGDDDPPTGDSRAPARSRTTTTTRAAAAAANGDDLGDRLGAHASASDLAAWCTDGRLSSRALHELERHFVTLGREAESRGIPLDLAYRVMRLTAEELLDEAKAAKGGKPYGRWKCMLLEDGATDLAGLFRTAMSRYQPEATA